MKFGFEKFFGLKTGESKASVPEHYEDTDAAKTGIRVKGFTHDTTTAPETVNTEAARFNDIKRGIEQIIIDSRIPTLDVLGRDAFYADKLVERKVLSAADVGFPGIMDDIRRAAREVAVQRANDEAEFRKTGIQKAA